MHYHWQPRAAKTPNFGATRGFAGCQNENLRLWCRQWPHSWHHNNCRFLDNIHCYVTHYHLTFHQPCLFRNNRHDGNRWVASTQKWRPQGHTSAPFCIRQWSSQWSPADLSHPASGGPKFMEHELGVLVVFHRSHWDDLQSHPTRRYNMGPCGKTRGKWVFLPFNNVLLKIAIPTQTAGSAWRT